MYKQGLTGLKAAIVLSLLISGCAMKVEQPDLALTTLEPLTPIPCDEAIERMDRAIQSMFGETVDEDDILTLRITNLDQVECLTDRYVYCESEYEGCKTTINGLEERFNKRE